MGNSPLVHTEIDLLCIYKINNKTQPKPNMFNDEFEQSIRAPDPVRRERLIDNESTIHYQQDRYNETESLRIAMQISKMEQEEMENTMYFENISKLMTERKESLRSIREKIKRVADYDPNIQESYIFLDSIFTDYEQLEYSFCQIGEKETYDSLISIVKKIRFTEQEKQIILSIIQLQ